MLFRPNQANRTLFKYVGLIQANRIFINFTDGLHSLQSAFFSVPPKAVLENKKLVKLLKTGKDF